MIDLGTAAAGAGIIVAGVFSGWQQVRTKHAVVRAQTEAAKAAIAASTAAEHAYPISNGWGAALREDVATQRQDTAAIRATVERINEALILNERRQTAQDERMQAITDWQTRHHEHHLETA